MTRSAILHEGRATADVHVQFQLLFEHFQVFGSSHSGIRRNRIQTSSATVRHSNPNHITRRMFQCGYSILLAKTLTQWPPNVHVARCRLLHGAFVIKQNFLPLQSFFFNTGVSYDFGAGLWDFSQNSLLRRLDTVLELFTVPFKRKLPTIFLMSHLACMWGTCLMSHQSLSRQAKSKYESPTAVKFRVKHPSHITAVVRMFSLII